MIKKHA